MNLLKFMGFSIGGCLIAVVIFLIVKAVDSKQGAAPGLRNQQLTACSPKPNCVCSEAGTPADKRVEPLPLTDNHAQDWQRLKQAIADLGGQVTHEESNYLAATFSSRLFGFVDDVEARFDSAQEVIHLRSASRVGTSDLGANRTRVQLLRNAYLR